MALVNPNIAMSYRGIEIPQQNALADYAAIQQIQGGRQAQELNALKMQEAQAAMQERNALRQLNPTAADYEAQLFKVSPQLGIQYRKEAATTAAQKATQAKAEFDLKAAQRKFGDDLKRSLSSNPSNENIIAFGQDAVLQGLYSPDQVESTVAQLLALPVQERARILSQAGASASELKPTVTPQNLGGTTQLISTPAFGGTATVVPGSVGAVTMTPAQIEQGRRDQQRLNLDVRKLAQDSDPDFVRKLAQARETGVAAAKDATTAAKVLPQVVSSANQTLSLIDTMIGKRDDKGNLVKGATPHPGFEASVGATLTPGMRFVPGSDAADFQSYFDQVKGGAFLQAFETLKGGGAITEKEGEKGTAALNRMNLAQSEKEFVTAAREFQNVVRAGVQRAQAKVPAAAGAANIDALLNKYK